MTQQINLFDEIALDTNLQYDLVSQYYDETNQKGYTIAELILLKKDTENKSLVKSLSGQLRKLRKETADLPPLPQPYNPPPLRTSLEKLSGLVNNHGFNKREYDKIKIPAVKSTAQTVTLVQDGEEITEILFAELPVSRGHSWEKMDYPKYNPSFSTTPYDRQLLLLLEDNQLTQRKSPLGLPVTTDLLREATRELFPIAAKKYFGTSGPHGQFIRLEAVNKVHLWAIQKPAYYTITNMERVYRKTSEKKSKDFQDRLKEETDPNVRKHLHQMVKESITKITSSKVFKFALEKYELALNKVFPFPNTIPKMRFKSQSMSKFEDEWNEAWNQSPPHGLISFNMSAHAGLLWPNKLHSETKASEMLFAAGIMNDLASGISTEDFWKKYDFIRLAEMKPKPEVYDRPDLDESGKISPTKIRNIFGTITAGAVPAMMLNAVSYKLCPNFLESPHSRSLLGFSPFHGGMDNLMRYALAIDKGPVHKPKDPVIIHTLVYADNLFIYYIRNNGEEFELVWISTDGAKMEASTNYEELQLEMLRLFKFLGGKLDTNQKFDSEKVNYAFLRYCLEVYPVLVTKGVAVYGSDQMNIPYMMSGVVGTGYFNTTKMAAMAADLEGQAVHPHTVASPVGFGPMVIELMEKHRIQLTLETYTVVKLGAKTRASDWYEHILVNSANSVIKLDLLGYDAFPVNVGGVRTILPVLMKDRLMNSMLFHKFGLYRKLQEDQQEYAILSLIVFRALYVIGGYAYPELALIIRGLIRVNLAILGLTPDDVAALQHKLQHSKITDFVSTMKSVLNLDDETELGDGFFHEFLSFSLPSISTVLRISGPATGYESQVGVVQDKVLKGFINKFGGATTLSSETELLTKINKSGFNSESREKVSLVYRQVFDAILRDTGTGELNLALYKEFDNSEEAQEDQSLAEAELLAAGKKIAPTLQIPETKTIRINLEPTNDKSKINSEVIKPVREDRVTVGANALAKFAKSVSAQFTLKANHLFLHVVVPTGFASKFLGGLNNGLTTGALNTMFYKAAAEFVEKRAKVQLNQAEAKASLNLASEVADLKFIVVAIKNSYHNGSTIAILNTSSLEYKVFGSLTSGPKFFEDLEFVEVVHDFLDAIYNPKDELDSESKESLIQLILDPGIIIEDASWFTFYPNARKISSQKKKTARSTKPTPILEEKYEEPDDDKEERKYNPPPKQNKVKGSLNVVGKPLLDLNRPIFVDQDKESLMVTLKDNKVNKALYKMGWKTVSFRDPEVNYMQILTHFETVIAPKVYKKVKNFQQGEHTISEFIEIAMKSFASDPLSTKI